MDRELLLLYTMAGFTVVAALALVVMAGYMIAAQRAIAALQERALQFMDRWEPVASSAKAAIDDTRRQTSEVLENVRAITETTRKQAEKVDSLLHDVDQTARIQLQRIDESLRQTLDKVEQATDAMQQTVLVPVRQVRGVAAAIQAVIGHLAAGGRKSRPTVDQATMDEEMFI